MRQNESFMNLSSNLNNRTSLLQWIYHTGHFTINDVKMCSDIIQLVSEEQEDVALAMILPFSLS